MEASLSTIDGQQVYRSPYDKYVQIAQPDILVLFKWKLFTSGKDQYLDFSIEVLDAYTSNLLGSVNKDVASEGFNWNLNNFIDAGIRQSADELRTLRVTRIDWNWQRMAEKLSTPFVLLKTSVSMITSMNLIWSSMSS